MCLVQFLFHHFVRPIEAAIQKWLPALSIDQFRADAELGSNWMIFPHRPRAFHIHGAWKGLPANWSYMDERTLSRLPPGIRFDDDFFVL